LAGLKGRDVGEDAADVGRDRLRGMREKDCQGEEQANYRN
jgi:hypothetical protein